jgi:hypothetical protein
MGEATANRLRTRLRQRTDQRPSIRIVERRVKPWARVLTTCDIRRPTGWQGFEGDPSLVPELPFSLVLLFLDYPYAGMIVAMTLKPSDLSKKRNG